MPNPGCDWAWRIQPDSIPLLLNSWRPIINCRPYPDACGVLYPRILSIQDGAKRLEQAITPCIADEAGSSGSQLAGTNELHLVTCGKVGEKAVDNETAVRGTGFELASSPRTWVLDLFNTALLGWFGEELDRAQV